MVSEYRNTTLVDLIANYTPVPGGDVTPLASWKEFTEEEAELARLADDSFEGKVKYVEYYKNLNPTYFDRGMELVNANISLFLGDDISQEQRDATAVDMIYSLHRFGCIFNEYFCFDFPNKSFSGRNEYITDKVRFMLYNKLNRQENHEIFANKGREYALLKKFYKRQLIEVTCDEDYPAFEQLMASNDKVIVKPADGSCGRNTFILHRKGYADLAEMFRAIRAVSGDVVVEEVIVQSEAMAKFHPESVNTLRIPAFRKKDSSEVVIFHPFARFGRGKSVVDNAGSGGIEAGIDVATGLICTQGMDKRGHNKYLFHPDTGVQITGTRIPRWEEAVELVTAAMQETTNRYFGWDLALTDDGWVVVETNSIGQVAGMQILNGSGLLKEFMAQI